MILAQDDSSSPSIAIIVLVSFFTPGMMIYFYHYFKVKWREQRFLPTSKGKESEAFVNVYICASVLMIKLDRRNATNKKGLLRNRMLALGMEPNSLWDTFDQIWDHEISERRIAKWCLKNLSPAERSDLVYLLIELAYLDESLLAREYAFLVKLMKSFKLPLEDLKSMMASHRQRMAREEGQRQNREREQRKTYQKTKKPSKTARELAFEVLGIASNSDEAAIKKAYRNLVKKHHPDRFAGSDEAIIKAAESRFIEIQNAYEIVSA
ncbi:MAG: hypothetical protein Crog4KO_01050 [Crocinitomicaceae bacterium]